LEGLYLLRELAVAKLMMRAKLREWIEFSARPMSLVQ
jgi:hypothetical protein